jgi:hypothetical protein
MIDTQIDSYDDLRAAARILNELAGGRHVESNTSVSEVEDSAATEYFKDASPAFIAPAPPPPPTPDVREAAFRLHSDASPVFVAPAPPGITPISNLAVEIALPAAPPPPPGPSVPAELDSRGYPWDGRIHASNRAKKIDGSWKNRRGVDANMIVAVEAQTKPGAAAVGAPPPVTIPGFPMASPTAQIAAVPTVSAVSAFVVGAANLPPVPPVAATALIVPPPPAPMPGNVAPAAAEPSTIDFRGLMVKIQTATSAGKLTTEQVNAALASVGLKPEEMAQLISNGLLVASVNAAIDACLSS